MKKFKLNKGEKIITEYPNSYCIAKTSNTCAVFAIPPNKKKDKGKVTDCGYIFTAFDKNTEHIKVGDWCELAYVSTFESAFYKIIKLL